MDRTAPGYRGFKDYTARFLKVYDRFVMGFVAPRVWRTTEAPGLELYRSHVGTRHLDVGPGTGYLLTRIDPPEGFELTLVDPNPNVLAHCAETLQSANPTLVEANVLEPLPVTGPFDSAGLAHVLHCLPGPMQAKAAAINHIADVLTDDGVLFGGTVLGRSAEHTLAGRAFLTVANAQGGFGNMDDSVDGLRHILEASFEEVTITVPSGPMAYFITARPKRTAAT